MIAAGPDPEAARIRLERWRSLGAAVPTDEPNQSILCAILSSGSFLPDLLFADPSHLEVLARDPWLRVPKPAPQFTREARQATLAAMDCPESHRRCTAHSSWFR